jgi:hypothetical protein
MADFGRVRFVRAKARRMVRTPDNDRMGFIDGIS